MNQKIRRRIRANHAAMERRAFLGATASAAIGAAIATASKARAQAAPCPTVDPGAPPPSTGAMPMTSLDQGTAGDWAVVEDASRAQQGAVAETVLLMVRNAEGVYAGFGVDQKVHMTQTATRAVRANATDELVLLSLCHDMGKVISNKNHPEIASSILRPYISDDSYRILRHHMEFQWAHYGEHILKPTDLRNRYIGLPWFDDASRFSDEWDQVAFDPAYDTLPLEEFEPLVRELLGRVPQRVNRTSLDCVNPV